MKKTALLIFFFVLHFIIVADTVSANTMPIGWNGANGGELFVMEDCPIRVSKERLYFKLDSRKTRYTLQSAVTAVYSLNNPTNDLCTISAMFPVIAGLDHEDPARTSLDDQEDQDGQEIFLNGEPIPFKIMTAALSEEELFQIHPAELLKRCMPLEKWDYYHNGDPQVLLLVFELTLAPNAMADLEISTTTQAFMERDVVFNYFTTKTSYTFQYFLSPAQYWDSFEDLIIELRLSSVAPVLQESSLPFRWVGGRRYRYQNDSLPEGELQFTVISSIWIVLFRIVAGILLMIGFILLTAKIRRRLMNKPTLKR